MKWWFVQVQRKKTNDLFSKEKKCVFPNRKTVVSVMFAPYETMLMHGVTKKEKVTTGPKTQGQHSRK